MRLIIEEDPGLQEEEVIIRCARIDNKIQNLYDLIKNNISTSQRLVFYKGDTEYYLDLADILFFETEDSTIYAHTNNKEFSVKLKLYELEQILPDSFVRVSKSAIINIKQIYSITKNLASSSLVEFQNSHKRLYVSRRYYSELRKRIN